MVRLYQKPLKPLVGKDENQVFAVAINITLEAARNFASDRGGGVIPGICRVPVCETRSST